MLEKYRATVDAIDRKTCQQVQDLLKVHLRWCPDTLFDLLDASGYGQADLVLCLLRINTPQALHHAGRIIGHPIRHFPPVERPEAEPFSPLLHKPLARLQRRFDADLDSPPVHATSRVFKVRRKHADRDVGRGKWGHAEPWYALIEAGLTVAQLLRRGVKLHDLRSAVREGSVVLS